ncbi:MAG: hypothetical protein Q8P68_05885 [Candidatus Peregrinibacteria bacterium]|nr:hypothetical protein [Candidatus Peregrinibacteria bacterium]MDZ4244961.1 hypothetical protein [Candidatus Gracilibacteria bacterium]
MAEIQSYNQEGERQKEKPKDNEPEASHEKLARQRKQRMFVQTMASGAFTDENLKGMLDHAEQCSAEEFSKMLIGEKNIPPLSEIIMKEKLWAMGVSEEEKKYPGLKERLGKKLAAEQGATTPTDRRILMAEAVWEIKYEAMDKLMPANLQADFKRYYGKYDRTRAMSKHGVARIDSVMPNCDEVAARMDRGITQRIVLEYTMLANEHFPPETVKLWTDHIKNAKNPQQAIQEFNELIGKGENQEGYIQKETKFNARRENLQKNNPAAHDFFLRLYNKETQEKLYASRDKVMDQAIANIDQAMKELSALTTDKELLDITKHETIDAILAKKNELKGKEPETPIDPNAITQMDEASLKKLIDGAREEAIVSDSEIQTLLLERKIVEAKKVEMRLRKGKTDDQLSEQRRHQLDFIKDNSARNKAESSEVTMQERNKEHEVFTSTDARKELFVIGDEGIGVKDADDQQRMARALNDMSDDQLAKDGLALGAVIDQKGEEILDDGGLQARQDILDRQIDAALGTHIRKKAIAAGIETGQAGALSKRNTRKDRLKDMGTAINSMLG